MKNKLKAILAKKEARKTELAAKSAAAADIAELRSINTELDGLNAEIAELRGVIDAMPDAASAAPAAPAAPAQPTGQAEQRSELTPAQVIATYTMQSGRVEQRSQEPNDPYGTVEYRNAFWKFATTGQILPELRADTVTATSDISAVVPNTIVNEVIRKITVYGQVFKRIRKLNVKGGISIPILSLKPTATWIGETTVSDKKKVQANTNVTFSYYGLECKVAVSLLADTVSLTGFETTITDLIVEAMIQAIDIAVVKGDGAGKLLGITVDTRVPAAQVVTLTSEEFTAWDAWKKKVFAKMPLAYKAGATFLMASGTFEGYIDGMVDANGQPIGRVNYGITDGPQERFGGKEVIQVEDDVIAPYPDANAGDVVGIYVNLNNYILNSNMQMTMFRYFDHDNNEWVDKAILIADGKLADANGVVIIKKGA